MGRRVHVMLPVQGSFTSNSSLHGVWGIAKLPMSLTLRLCWRTAQSRLRSPLDVLFSTLEEKIWSWHHNVLVKGRGCMQWHDLCRSRPAVC